MSRRQAYAESCLEGGDCMTRHLISATLTTPAFTIYKRWVEKRQGSLKISRAIEEAEILIQNEEAFRRYKKVTLPNMIARMLREMDDEAFRRLPDTIRGSICMIQEGANLKELRKMGWSYINQTKDGTNINRLDDEIYRKRRLDDEEE